MDMFLDLLLVSTARLAKSLNINHLEARGVEPLFPACYVRRRPRMVSRAISEANTFSWISVDEGGCY
jgi:hypothetical protein